MYNGISFDIFAGNTILYGYHMSCQVQWYVEHHITLPVWELWPYEVGGPSYVGLKPQKVKEIKKRLQRRNHYLNDKVKWQSQ